MMDEEVYGMVGKVPRGKVTSYGKIAKALFISPRQVGRILHNNPSDEMTPCHRVVMADGSLASGYAFGGLGEQRKRLEVEGVKFRNNKVMKEYFV